MGYKYHDAGELRDLGERIRDKAIEVSLQQYHLFGRDHYGDSQVRANDYPDQHPPGTGPLEGRGYVPDRDDSQDDAENVKRFVAAENADIPDLFASLSIPDPARCQEMVDALFQTAAGLSPNLEVTVKDGKAYYPELDGQASPSAPVKNTVNFIKTHMQHWDGTAADAFKGYMDRFENAATAQYDLACALAVTLEMQIEIRKKYLTDVWNIGKKTLKALEALKGGCPDRNQWAVTLSVATAIAGVVLAVPTGGATLVVAGTGLTATVLGLPSSDAPKDHIGGETVPAVVGSMRRVLSRETSLTDAEQQEIASCLKKLTDEVDANIRNIELQPPDKMLAMRNAAVDVLDRQRHFYNR